MIRLKDDADTARLNAAELHIHDELNEAQRLAQIGSWYWDAATDASTGSKELCRIFGCKTMPAFSQQCGTLFAPEAWQQLSTARQESMRNGTSYHLELPALCQGKTPVWVISRGEAVRNAWGSIVGLRGTVQDISARKQAELALSKSELKNQVLFNKNTQATALAKLPEGILVDVNEEWVRLFGYSRDEALGKSTLELGLHPNPEVRAQVIAELKRTGQVRNLELTLVTKNGVACNILLNINLLNFGGQDYALSTTQDITELRRIETKSRFQDTLLDVIGQAVIATDIQGNITYLNQAAEILYGWHTDEALGRNIMEVTVPRVSHSQADEIMACLAAGNAWSGEFVAQHRDGTTFMVQVHDTPIFDASGKLSGIIGISNDISERKRVDDALKMSKQLLDFSLQLTHTGSWNLDLNNNTTIRTLEHDNIFGYPTLLPQWNYDMFLEHVIDVDRPEVDRLYQHSISTQTDWNTHCRIRRADGEIRWIMVAGANHRDALGKVRNLSGIVRDITELKTAADTRHNANAYARSLIEASLDPLVTINAQGKITDVNEASIQATGVAREQLIGTDFSDYFTEPERARSGYQKVFSEGLVHDYPLAIRHVSGAVMEVLYNATVYKDNMGNVLGVFAAARDVTERNRLDLILKLKNLEVQNAKTIAEKASLAKSNFLSSMSHELRTPLNAILGFAQLLENGKPEPTDSQNKRLQQIIKAGWYLLELINEILDLSVIESGKLVMQLEQLALADVLQDCQSMVFAQASQRGIQVSYHACDEHHFALADRTRLKQVLVNLLSNAIKYNRKDGTVQLTTTALAANRIRISIKDSGMGLSAAKLQQLFQPFNRLGQEFSSEEGTGIGLVVAKQLVELMGGSIGVESTLGEGSEFWIELARSEAELLPAFNSMPEHTGIPARNIAQDNPKKYNLLYLEDHPANLMRVKEMLEECPHISMSSARNGTIGIALARSCLPDIILMDINLPGISGIKALQILRQDPATKHIPIVALSDNGIPEDIERGLAAGFFRYLAKPFIGHELMTVLNESIKYSSKESPTSTLPNPYKPEKYHDTATGNS